MVNANCYYYKAQLTGCGEGDDFLNVILGEGAPEKRIKVYFPPSNFSCDLKDNLIHHSSKPVLMYKNERRFRDAIMPDVVTDGTKRYEVPEKWRPANIVR